MTESLGWHLLAVDTFEVLWTASKQRSLMRVFVLTDARTCYHANCQYGCEVIKGLVRCTCPSPGLRLGPDRRTCVGRSVLSVLLDNLDWDVVYPSPLSLSVSLSLSLQTSTSVCRAAACVLIAGSVWTRSGALCVNVTSASNSRTSTDGTPASVSVCVCVCVTSKL